MSNFDKIIPLVLVHEGGWVNNPNDPGGATNRGISLRFLAGTHDTEIGDIDKDGDIDANDIKNLSEEDAIKIYKKYFWDEYDLDRYEENINLQYAMFDMIVNAGPGTGLRLLQKVINRYNNNNIAVDGRIGPGTLAAYNAIQDKSYMDDEYLLERLQFYHDLAEKKPKLKEFLRGWANRVNNVRNDFSKLS
jgi:lysozyme family protein